MEGIKFAVAKILAEDWMYSILTVGCLVRRHMVILERRLSVKRSIAQLIIMPWRRNVILA